MSKKIAFFLIMVMFVNMAVWADDGDDSSLVLYAVGISLIVLGAVILPLLLSEAEAPDDGIRLASMQTVNPESKTGGAVLNILQHIEVGQTKDNKFYTGLRFRF